MDGRPLPEDVVALGSERGPRFTTPGWRPSRPAAILAVVTLLAGLAVGYAIGNRPSGPARAAARSAASSADQPDFTLYGPVLTEEPGTCSTQVGDDLELGIPVTNRSAETVLLESAEPVAGVPGLLKVLSWSWAPCGFGGDGIIPDTVRTRAGPDHLAHRHRQATGHLPGPGPPAVPRHLLGQPAAVLVHAAGLLRPQRRPLQRLPGPLMETEHCTRMIAKPAGRLRRSGPFTRDNAGTASPLDLRMTFR